MTGKTSFKGAVTEIITPFDENGEVNETLLRNEVDFQVKAGIRGLFTNGLASEVLAMNVAERIEVTKIVFAQTGGRVPVMANIIGNNLKDCLKEVKAYTEMGVEALSLTQPCTYGYTQKGIYEFFAELIQATPLPICIYNAPQTQNTLTPETIIKLLNDFDNVVYYKESTIDVVHMQNTMFGVNTNKEYEFLAGSDATIYAIGLLGGVGIVSLISAVFPEPIIKLCNLLEAGRLEEARVQQQKVLLLRSALKIGPFMAGYKYAGELIGLPLGQVREPLVGLTDAEKEKLKTNLEGLGLVSY